MKLHFTFFLFLFSLNCFSLEHPSKELAKAYKKFESAHSEHANLSTVDNSTIAYLVTDRMYQVPQWISPLPPHGFRWNASKRTTIDKKSYDNSLNTDINVKIEVNKCNLRRISKAPCENLEKIISTKPKIWLMKYKATAASQVLDEYSLLWVERGLYTEEEWTYHLENSLRDSLLRSCPPQKLTLRDFEFLGVFMSKQKREETFSSAAHGEYPPRLTHGSEQGAQGLHRSVP